jgi:hypothetical protein
MVSSRSIIGPTLSVPLKLGTGVAATVPAITAGAATAGAAGAAVWAKPTGAKARLTAARRNNGESDRCEERVEGQFTGGGGEWINTNHAE